MTEKEYRSVAGDNTDKYSFPIISDYTLIGRDLTKEGILRHKAFGYSETRMVPSGSFVISLKRRLPNIRIVVYKQTNE